MCVYSGDVYALWSSMHNQNAFRFSVAKLHSVLSALKKIIQSYLTSQELQNQPNMVTTDFNPLCIAISNEYTHEYDQFIQRN